MYIYFLVARFCNDFAGCYDNHAYCLFRVELEGIDLGDVKHFSVPELREFTDNFSQDNFFCGARHGRVFKGQISNRRVVVKTLDFYFPMTKFCVYTMSRLHVRTVSP